MFRATAGAKNDFGWPYCFYDYGQKKFLVNPEYGGDGKDGARCAQFTNPVAVLPGALGPGRRDVLHRLAVPEEVPGRRLHRVPRLVESRARTAGAGQHHVPADLGRQASGEFEVFAKGFAKEPLKTSATRSTAPMAWRRPGRLALHLREPEGSHLAGDVSAKCMT
jgi:hypothetical protein